LASGGEKIGTSLVPVFGSLQSSANAGAAEILRRAETQAIPAGKILRNVIFGSIDRHGSR
jgi:hypothetical protein